MPLEHAPSTEILFRSLQHDRARNARHHARRQRAHAILRGAPVGHRLAVALRHIRSAAARAAGRAGDNAGDNGRTRSTSESVTRPPASHPEPGAHRSTTTGVPCPSCA